MVFDGDAGTDGADAFVDGRHQRSWWARVGAEIVATGQGVEIGARVGIRAGGWSGAGAGIVVGVDERERGRTFALTATMGLGGGQLVVFLVGLSSPKHIHIRCPVGDVVVVSGKCSGACL